MEENIGEEMIESKKRSKSVQVCHFLVKMKIKSCENIYSEDRAIG